MDETKAFEFIQEIIKGIRQMRNDNKIPSNKVIEVKLESENDDKLALLISQKHIIENMAKFKLSFLI